MILILMISHGTHGIHGRKNRTKEKINHLFSAVKIYLLFPYLGFPIPCSQCYSVANMYLPFPQFVGGFTVFNLLSTRKRNRIRLMRRMFRPHLDGLCDSCYQNELIPE